VIINFFQLFDSTRDSNLGLPLRGGRFHPIVFILQVKATDADLGMNSVISYSLEGRYSRMFDIDARTGVVTSRRTPDVNVEGGNVKFNVTVIARDMGKL